MTAPAITRMPIADSRSVVREIRGALVGQGTRLVAVVATMIVGAALGLVAPWVLGRMVDAVIGGAGVGEIFSLQPDRGAASVGGEPRCIGERCRTAHVISQKAVEFREKGGIFGSLRPRRVQLIKGRHERFGDEPATKAAEPSAWIGGSGNA